MNLFARILSHGFALAVVALLAIGLIYRGELFPDLELPGFLSFESSGDSSDTSAGAPPPEETAPPSGESVRVGAAGLAEPAGPAAGPETAPSDEGVVITSPLVEEASLPAEPEAAPGGEGEAVPPVSEEVSLPAGPEPAAIESAEESMPLPVPAAVEVPAVPEASRDVAPPAALEGEPAPAAIPDTAVTGEPETPAPAGVDAVEPAPDTSAEVPPETPSGSQDVGEAAPAAVETGQTVEAGEADSGIPDTSGEQQVEAPPGAVAETSTYRLLAAAREAYWLRDYEQAEQQYLALIDMDPDNPDGYGELGNMYFSQGDWDKAASAYYEAGVRLVEQGLADHARQLVEVIRRLNGSQASQLEEKIRASAAPAAE